MLSGSVVPFETEMQQELHKEFLLRQRNPEKLGNHLKAIKLSEDLIREVPSQVKVPTLIIQGSEDPIYAPDHGEALARAIPNSTYLYLYGLGHVPNGYFYPQLIEAIKILSELASSLKKITSSPLSLSVFLD